MDVAAQKFGGEAGTLKAVQAINRLRRAPILRGHGVSSRFVLSRRDTTIRKFVSESSP